jgi:NAD(P)-dependent dehydrogenase (short-subunit alcohol dehydrogenase family)
MNKKIALVSGANKGLGKETAKKLGNLGFKVFMGSRDKARGEAAEKELKKENIDVETLSLDVNDEASVRAAIDTIKSKCGHLDVLVNNAGILTERNTDISSTDIAGVEETMSTNFFGPLKLLQASIPLLEKSDAPRVVNVSSSLGSLTRTSDPNSQFTDFLYLGYCCSKAALNMMTVVASASLKSKNFKVNSVCPGYVATDINEHQGYRTVEQGAAIIVKMATLDKDGPTGGYFNDEGVVPW